jgi:hypothetical protein
MTKVQFANIVADRMGLPERLHKLSQVLVRTTLGTVRVRFHEAEAHFSLGFVMRRAVTDSLSDHLALGRKWRKSSADPSPEALGGGGKSAPALVEYGPECWRATESS